LNFSTRVYVDIEMLGDRKSDRFRTVQRSSRMKMVLFRNMKITFGHWWGSPVWRRVGKEREREQEERKWREEYRLQKNPASGPPCALTHPNRLVTVRSEPYLNQRQ
jgi:hypothetical protein